MKVKKNYWHSLINQEKNYNKRVKQMNHGEWYKNTIWRICVIFIFYWNELTVFSQSQMILKWCCRQYHSNSSEFNLCLLLILLQKIGKHSPSWYRNIALDQSHSVLQGQCHQWPSHQPELHWYHWILMLLTFSDQSCWYKVIALSQSHVISTLSIGFISTGTSFLS